MSRRRTLAGQTTAASAQADDEGARAAEAEFAALRLQTERAFKKAAEAAVAENDRLGIATHGALRGKLVIRAPSKRRKSVVA